MTLSYPPPFQDIATLSQHTCMSERTIETLVKEKRFPEPRKNKCGKRLWVWKEVEQFLAAPEDDDGMVRLVHSVTWDIDRNLNVQINVMLKD